MIITGQKIAVNTSAFLRCQIQDENGNLVGPSNVSAITGEVVNTVDGTVTPLPAIVVAGVMYSTVQTPGDYNFQYVLPEEFLASAGNVQVTFTFTAIQAVDAEGNAVTYSVVFRVFVFNPATLQY